MLIKAFKLEDSKPVVTPGVKPLGADGDPDSMDSEIAEEINAIIASLSPASRRPSKVSFSPDVDLFNVVVNCSASKVVC